MTVLLNGPDHQPMRYLTPWWSADPAFDENGKRDLDTEAEWRGTETRLARNIAEWMRGEYTVPSIERLDEHRAEHRNLSWTRDEMRRVGAALALLEAVEEEKYFLRLPPEQIVALVDRALDLAAQKVWIVVHPNLGDNSSDRAGDVIHERRAECDFCTPFDC